MNINGQKLEAGDMINFFPQFDPNEAVNDIPMQDERDISRILRESNDVANIPFRFHTSTFNNFDCTFKDQLIDFCLNPKDKIVIIMGGVGTGKTSLACSAIHERAINELNYGLYFSNLTLPVVLRTCRSFTAKENEESLIRRLSTTPFLVLDEFGVCKNITEESDFVSTVLRCRYDNGLPTLIATNLSAVGFKLVLCGHNPSDYTKEQSLELVERLERENPTLNRVKSVATAFVIHGPSHR